MKRLILATATVILTASTALADYVLVYKKSVIVGIFADSLSCEEAHWEYDIVMFSNLTCEKL